MKKKQPKFPPELIRQLLGHAEVKGMTDLAELAGQLQKAAASRQPSP